jgi:hypothetical protein
MFIISPHTNWFHEKSSELGQRLASWPKPSLALVKGTWLGEMDGSLTVGVLNKNAERDEPFSRELSESGLDRLMIKIKTALRKLTPKVVSLLPEGTPKGKRL